MDSVSQIGPDTKVGDTVRVPDYGIGVVKGFQSFRSGVHVRVEMRPGLGVLVPAKRAA